MVAQAPRYQGQADFDRPATHADELSSVVRAHRQYVAKTIRKTGVDHAVRRAWADNSESRRQTASNVAERAARPTVLVAAHRLWIRSPRCTRRLLASVAIQRRHGDGDHLQPVDSLEVVGVAGVDRQARSRARSPRSSRRRRARPPCGPPRRSEAATPPKARAAAASKGRGTKSASACWRWAWRLARSPSSCGDQGADGELGEGDGRDQRLGWQRAGVGEIGARRMHRRGVEDAPRGGPGSLSLTAAGPAPRRRRPEGAPGRPAGSRVPRLEQGLGRERRTQRSQFGDRPAANG